MSGQVHMKKLTGLKTTVPLCGAGKRLVANYNWQSVTCRECKALRPKEKK